MLLSCHLLWARCSVAFNKSIQTAGSEIQQYFSPFSHFFSFQKLRVNFFSLCQSFLGQGIAFSLSITSLLFSVGETTNLMQIDSQKFLDLSLYLNMAWISPLQIVLAMYFLWGILGPSSLAGKYQIS